MSIKEESNTLKKTPEMQRGLNESEAAKYIGMSKSYLQKDRIDGALPGRTPGPRWLKAGKRVLYLKDDLDKWLESLHNKKRGDETDF